MNFPEEYKQLHARGFFNGLSALKQKDQIKNIISETNSKTVLDYGSGKGHQYSVHKLDKIWKASVDCYDPYVENFSILKDQIYDGVICTDVLEHVPESDLNKVLTEIFQRAGKFVFFCIFLKPARKSFSDGSNVHVTLKSIKEWQNILNSFNINKIKLKIVFRGE